MSLGTRSNPFNNTAPVPTLSTSTNIQKIAYKCDRCGLGFLNFKNKLAHQTSLCWKRDDEFTFQDEISRLKNTYSTSSSLNIELLPSYPILEYSILDTSRYNSPRISAYNRSYNNYLIKKLSHEVDLVDEELKPRKVKP
jgi:hypothetical protein